MNNDGVVGRSALDLEYAPNCVSVQRAGSQPIHGLRRQRHHLSRAQECSRPLHGGLEQLRRVRRQNFGDNGRPLFHGTNVPVTSAPATDRSAV